MERIRYIIIFTICLLIFAPVLPASTNASEEWEKALYLSEKDRTRLDSYLSMDNGYVEKLIGETLDKYYAHPDYSKAYVRYRVYDGLIMNAYNAITDSVIYNQENYDGLPVDALRYIVIPAYKDGELIGEVRIIDWNPEALSYDDVYPPCTPNSDGPCYSGGEGWMDLANALYTIENNEEQENAELGYDIIESTGAEIQAIFFTEEYYNLYKTDQGYYVYPTVISGEEEKGKQAMLLDEFIKGLVNGNVSEPMPEPSSTPTPTPTPTPRLSRTMATPRPTVTTPTATPGAGETAAPEIADTASVISSASAMPEPRVNKTAWGIIGIVLICVLGGGAAGTAVFVRRRKAGK